MKGPMSWRKAPEKPGEPSGPVEYCVVGLGNPGRQYELTRHNAGFLCIEQLAARCGAAGPWRLKFQSLYAAATIAGHRCLLVKPQTFMNLSGESVREWLRFYKLPPERVIILLDDITLDVGCLRIRRKGSDGGQNGMKNIIYLTGSDQFPRIKIGIGGKPHPDYDLAAWVTSAFTANDQTLLPAVFDKACQAVELMVDGRVDEAMNRFNSNL